MAVLEPIIQALREWLFQTTKLDRLQIIPADEDGVRPELPYLTIDIVHLDDPGGTDELLGGTDTKGRPIAYGRGFRQGQITVNGYGPSSADLIMQASVQLTHPRILRLMCDRGFSLRPISPLLDLSELVSTKIEKRFAKDFSLQYLLVDEDPEVLVEMMQLEVELTLERTEDNVDALIDTLTITC